MCPIHLLAWYPTIVTRTCHYPFGYGQELFPAYFGPGSAVIYMSPVIHPSPYLLEIL